MEGPLIKGLNVIVTCTDRKRLVAANMLQLRNVQGAGIEARLDRWCKSLFESNQEVKSPAHNVYMGPLWAANLDFFRYASAVQGIPNCKLWVASAGYGLISANDKISGYSATFANGSMDSVGSRTSDWWNGLCKRSRASGRQVSTVSDVARNSPDWLILIVGSISYIRAMRHDIENASKLTDPDLLMVASAMSDSQRNRRELDSIRPYLLPVSAKSRMLDPQNPKPRAQASLMAAKHIISSCAYTSLDSAKAVLTDIERDLPDESMPVRNKTTDGEVRDFIVRRLKNQPEASKTQLLREFRAFGKACEQSRFGKIFNMEK